MKTLTILSGKGGVGKSSIAASLAVLLKNKKKVVTVDCDVDAPNLALVLGLEEEKFDSWEDIQTSEKAELINEKCTGCKKCFDICNFSAIGWNEKEKKPIFNRLLCEGCGACQLVCPENAIILKKVKNAKIGLGKTKYGFPIISGQLKMGESGSGKVVDSVKQKAGKIAEKINAEVMIVDSAAGIGCPVIASIRGSDYIIAVTEPTPAALWDLQRVLQVVEHFQIPYGVVINKWDLNKEFSKKIEEFIAKTKIDMLGKISYDKKFVEALVKLEPIVIYDKKFEKTFLNILDRIPLDLSENKL